MFQETLLSNLIADTFGQHKLLEAREVICPGQLLTIFCKKSITRLQGVPVIRKLLDFETMSFMQKNRDLSNSKQKWLAKYKEARALIRTQKQCTPSMTPPASVPTQLTFSSISDSTKSPFQFDASSNKNKSSSSRLCESTLRNGFNAEGFQSANDIPPV
ncbi:hypothetical protein C8Q75DRAFT_805994 [Abortiporus biennis]|nr:hypothetical protein C8Q75DRAFT_805994 [Abortiporus biennis]